MYRKFGGIFSVKSLFRGSFILKSKSVGTITSVWNVRVVSCNFLKVGKSIFVNIPPFFYSKKVLVAIRYECFDTKY